MVSKNEVRAAVTAASGTNAFRTYALKEALPVLEVLWQSAPWYVRMFFKLVDAIHDYLEEEYAKPPAKR